jgi:hypothetical protein
MSAFFGITTCASRLAARSCRTGPPASITVAVLVRFLVVVEGLVVKHITVTAFKLGGLPLVEVTVFAMVGP